jgi:uncharacterized membrane protein YvbJ
MKKCQRCGFNNPDNATTCLQCGRSLPKTRAEVKEAFRVLDDVASGRFREVGGKVAGGVVKEEIEQVKTKV